MSANIPSAIRIVESGLWLELEYVASQYRLPAAWLRLRCPSAEYRSGWVNWDKLTRQKQAVRLLDAQGVGHYALRLIFDDGHHTGLYTWSYLLQLAESFSRT